MDKQRQEAINNAKKAAGNSVAFVLRGSLRDGERLVKHATLTAKESITLQKNISTIVTRVNVLNGIVKNIKKALKSKSDDSSKVTRIASLISADGNAYKLQEALMEEKPGITSAIHGATKSLSKSVGWITAIAALFPLLMSPQVKETIMGFFKGFLNGLGINAKKLEELQPYIKMAIGALTAVFAYKALSTVYQSFLSLKKLGQALGLVAIAIDQKAKTSVIEDGFESRKSQMRDDLKGRMSTNRAEQTKHQKWWDRLSKKDKKKALNRKYHEKQQAHFEKMNKLDIEQRKNLGGLSEADELRRKDRLAKVAKAKRVKDLKSIKGILGITAKALKVSGIGFAVGVGIDAIGGTIIDMATADDEVELDGETVIKMAVNNIAQSLTFGIYKGPFEIKSNKAGAVPQKGSTSAAPGPSPTSSTRQEAPAPIPSAAAPVAATKDLSFGGSAPVVEAKNGAQIENLSRNVEQIEVDKAKQMGNHAIFINNSSNVVVDEGKKQTSTGQINFSTSVGR